MKEIIATIAQDIVGISIISVWIVSLFVISEYLKRVRKLESETTRKFVHFGAGPIILSFPWIVSSSYTVGLLCMAFFLILVVGKKTGLLSGVHSVERETSGAFIYPVAVWICFTISDADPLLFCLPIAILAVADAGAALIGKKHGQHKYEVYDGMRSLEGSLTFFVLSFSLSILFFTIAQEPGWPEMLLIALLLALMTTALEGISILGLDNILIPYGGFLLLERSLRMGLDDLAGWFEGMLITSAIILFSWKRIGLTEAGALSIFIAGSFAWALGDWFWSTPLLSLYLLFFVLVEVYKRFPSPSMKDKRYSLEDILPTVLGALIFILLFAHFQEDSLLIPYITALSSGGAIALGRFGLNRKSMILPLMILGAITPTLPFLLMKAPFPYWKILLSSFIGVLIFYILRRSPLIGRRLLATLLAGALAWAIC
jgi:phytol kinase